MKHDTIPTAAPPGIPPRSLEGILRSGTVPADPSAHLVNLPAEQREGGQMVKRKHVSRCNAPACCLFVLFLGMSGCASLSPSAAKIQEAGKDTVSGCRYLGEVTGTSKVGSESAVLYHTGKDNARKDALEKAARLGGTHIVWRPLIDARPIIAVCDVYLCGEPAR